MTPPNDALLEIVKNWANEKLPREYDPLGTALADLLNRLAARPPAPEPPRATLRERIMGLPTIVPADADGETIWRWNAEVVSRDQVLELLATPEPTVTPRHMMRETGMDQISTNPEPTPAGNLRGRLPTAQELGSDDEPAEPTVTVGAPAPPPIHIGREIVKGWTRSRVYPDTEPMSHEHLAERIAGAINQARLDGAAERTPADLDRQNQAVRALEQILESCKHESDYTKVDTIRKLAETALQVTGAAPAKEGHE
jgi:hypothetical protein